MAIFRYLNSPRRQLSLDLLVGSFYSCPNMTILLKIGVSRAVPSPNPEPLKNVFTLNFPKNLKIIGVIRGHPPIRSERG